MKHIPHTILLFLFLLAADATSQTVTQIADVDIGPPFYLLRTRLAMNGQYATCPIDTIGVLRLRSYPTEQRDTLAIPDSVTNVWAIGVTAYGSLFTYESRATGLVHLAAIAHDDTVWQFLPIVLPSVDPTLGTLRQYVGSIAIAASGQRTVAIVATYVSSTTPSQVNYRTVLVNAQTYAVIRTYDEIRVSGVTPGNRSYYCLRVAPDSTVNLCTYIDASTGDSLRTVRCGRDYYAPSGIDHVMVNSREIGNVEEVPFPLLTDNDRIEGILQSPNVLCVQRSTDDLSSIIEAYDVLADTSVLISPIGGYVSIDDVDQVVSVLSTRPFRLRVYALKGVKGREGLACLRNTDTADIYQRVTYGVVNIGRSNVRDVTATIGGESYAMRGRTEPLVLSHEKPGTVAFSAVTHDRVDSAIYQDSLASLFVRYPSGVTASIRVDHSASELALSADEHSLSIGTDSATTIVRLNGSTTPDIEVAHAFAANSGTLDITQCDVLPADSYVHVVYREDDPTIRTYNRSVDQVIRHVGSNDSALIRSIWLAPELAVQSVQTVSNAQERMMGLYVVTFPSSASRLYLTRLIDDTWVPYGDTSGIKILGWGTVDLSVPGHIISEDGDGRVVKKRIFDTTTIIDVNVESRSALVINDSTILTPRCFWIESDGSWKYLKSFRSSEQGVDVVRLSAGYSALIWSRPGTTGYIVDITSRSIVDSLGRGFSYPTCAVYSKRFHGLFIGHQTGVVGFVPIPPGYETPTLISMQRPTQRSTSITSCVVYTVAGSRIREIPCASQLSDTDAAQLHLPNGLYIIVYAQEHGPAFSRMLMVWQ